MRLFPPPGLRVAASVLASAVMAGLYVRGGAGWILGFVLFVPWLTTLDSKATGGAILLRSYAMCLAYTAAAFAWFGIAFGQYIQIGPVAGTALLLVAAPLFQPQFFAFALMRHVVGRRHGQACASAAAALAWVAAEWLIPRLLGDTLGYGLYPSPLLRQGADLGGGAGLTLLLLLTNEALAAAYVHRADGFRVVAKPLALAVALPLLLAGYGFAVLAAPPAPAAQALRVGLIQSNFVAYEQARQERGSYRVVREVLDTHFAMSYDAVVRQHADAVLWPETAYPTTFGHPKSEAGAQFDRAIVDIVNAAGVPFVIGTYDRDSAGEYNAAAFVQPGTGLLGFYRKTRLFPLTEYVPSWLDSPWLRSWLPWTGNWRAGNGARVFPLRLRDGREVPVLPLICRDAVDPRLAIDGARLGAQAILTMSNDAWFSNDPLGARMHQTVAAFRSIETRLPQFRVTTNGYSAVIDATGTVLAGTGMGERSLVIAGVTVRAPARTLMVMWGDWVGRAAACALLALGACSLLLAWGRRSPAQGDAQLALPALPLRVALLPPAARLAAALCHGLARAGLLAMCLALLIKEPLRTNTLGQMRMFLSFFLLPQMGAWCLLYLYAGRADIDGGQLRLTRGTRRIALALADLSQVQAWRLPWPSSGLSLRLASGQHWYLAVAGGQAHALARAMAHAGAPIVAQASAARPMLAYACACNDRQPSRLDHPLAKYVLLPLALAIPAFHLQQQIAYGGAFGEYYSFGLKAYLSAFALWWAAWSIGVVLSATLLRATIETGALLAALWRPARSAAARRSLERGGHVALFVGLPGWLLLTVLHS